MKRQGRFSCLTIFRVSAAAFLLLLQPVLLISAGPAEAGDAVNKDTRPFVGQWIWSRTDARIFQKNRRNLSDLVPCVWVSTISASSGKITQRLANTPRLADPKCPVAIIVRFDDSFHTVWDSLPRNEIAKEVDRRLETLLGLVGQSGMKISEVHLDYDCPMRSLGPWAEVVRSLAAGSLRSREVWITSLPSHLEEPHFSSWFSGIVAGHILQLFDTGIYCDSAAVRKISDLLRRQDLAFRFGLGAFERAKGPKTTNHRLWFSALPVLSSIPGYRGVWIFPGGEQWISLM